MLRGLAADEGGAGLGAAGGDAAHDVGDALGEDLAARDVVGHEERLGADHDDVVDDHADQVEADRVVLVDGLRDRDLRADAVGAGREQRLGVAAQRRGVEQARESADSAQDLGAVRAADGGLHQLDREVACGRVDPGCGIGIHGGVARGGSHGSSLPAACLGGCRAPEAPDRGFAVGNRRLGRAASCGSPRRRRRRSAERTSGPGSRMAMAGMGGTGSPEWLIREDASQPVLLALYLRQVLGIRSPDELPHLRGIPPRANDRSEEAQALLERQWREYWAMTVEPQAHPSPVPLDLVDGFETLLALPTEGAEALRSGLRPARAARRSPSRSRRMPAIAAMPAAGAAYRAYASAIAEHERQVGRRAHSFELNVQVLPLSQRGVWWIGSLTVAVTDGLRGDVVAFDAAIHPIIAELA